MPAESTTAKSRYRPLLLAAAILFAATAIVYSAGWMYCVRHPIQVEIGFEESYSPAGISIDRVRPNTPGERAGLQAKDLIIAINGNQAAPAPEAWRDLLYRTWLHSRPGDKVALTLQRAGQGPLTLTPTFRAIQGVGDTKTVVRTLAEQIVDSYPLLFLIVGLAVLFLRVDDRNAWLLVLVFATFITAAESPDNFAATTSSFRTFLLAYRSVANTLLPGLFYFFFAVFPTRSPIDRKLPWLKWTLPAISLALGLGGVQQGNSMPLPFLAAVIPHPVAYYANLVVAYGALFLGLASLLWNVFSVSNLDDRRKLKVILWGTVAGVTPAALISLVQNLVHFETPFWLNFFKVILLFLFPLSFGYAVVKHRVMDIPLLLKRSARYFVVERGFVFLILAIGVGLTFWLGQAFSKVFAAGTKAAIPVGATFGVLLITAGTQVHRRVRTRLDRAFFRSAYDAQQILENLAAKTVTVTSREQLAALLEENISEALHPQSMAVYLANENGQLAAYAGDAAARGEIFPLSAPEFGELLDATRPIDLLPGSGPVVAGVDPECLVPVRTSSDGALQGVIALGPRLSEELYSTGDKRLLASVASQAAVAMRSVSMAEKMAERMEAERRAAQEMEIARQVQSKLLPQEAPSLETLQCAGACIQTRAVGGDYYDFLDLGAGGLGLVLADISGKGISGALLMANLQANLRSQYALALEDMPRLLRSVNRLFYKNTENNHYATTFFAVYDDQNRKLRYVNCGHNPPMVVRKDSSVERLEATATVLGLFEEWDCTVAECDLSIDDVLVIYTDGISEAPGLAEEEFGEERLIANIQRHQTQSAAEIMAAIITEVQSFQVGEQADDMTMIVAKAR